MTPISRLTLAAAVLAGFGLAEPAAAKEPTKERRHGHPTQIRVVDLRGPVVLHPCAVEVYPYAPSACLRGGFIEFDGKAYFAPGYGYRAYRYNDGW